MLKRLQRDRKDYAEEGKKYLPVIIVEFTEKLPGVKPPTSPAIHNLKARCDKTEKCCRLTRK
jgi:hypothetical protein